MRSSAVKEKEIQQRKTLIRVDVVLMDFRLQPRCGGKSRLADGRGGDLSYNPKGHGYFKGYENQES